MSIQSHLQRLSNARDILAAAERYKFSYVKRWHRLKQLTPLEGSPQDLGGNVYRIHGEKTRFLFDTREVYGDDATKKNCKICFAIMPIGEEDLQFVYAGDADAGTPEAMDWELTKDITSSGLVTYNRTINLWEDEGVLTFHCYHESQETEVFIGVYCQHENSTELIDGTESVDELAISLYNTPSPYDDYLDTMDATATANDVLKGATFYAKGAKLTGKIARKGVGIITLDLSDGFYYNNEYVTELTIPSGYYDYLDFVKTQELTDSFLEVHYLENNLSKI